MLSDAVRGELRNALADVMSTYDVPAAVAGIWLPGEEKWLVAEGLADLDDGDAVTMGMTWPIRSITKSFTVTLLLQLADERRLDLDDPIGDYVDGVPNGEKVTVRQLANMTSGLPEYTTQAFIEAFLQDPDRIFTPAELLAYAFDEPPRAEPGEEAVYTNTNTILLGAAIEKVTGQPLNDVLAQRILGPLALRSTLATDDDAEWPAPHATGYQPDEGDLAPQPTNLSVFGAAGNMLSTVDDLRVWAESLATGERISAATQAERLEARPLDEGPEYDAYGLGIGRLEDWWGHTGEGIGFTALIMHEVRGGATVVILMNLSNADRHPPTVLFRRFAEILRR